MHTRLYRLSITKQNRELHFLFPSLRSFAAPLFTPCAKLQCCGSDPDPQGSASGFTSAPNQIKIRIRIKIYKLDPEQDPDPHHFADVKSKCIEYEPNLALFRGFEHFLKLGSGSGSASG
jgi:hypothetical protein